MTTMVVVEEHDQTHVLLFTPFADLTDSKVMQWYDNWWLQDLEESAKYFVFPNASMCNLANSVRRLRTRLGVLR